jgi:hypothetical protein
MNMEMKRMNHHSLITMRLCLQAQALAWPASCSHQVDSSRLMGLTEWTRSTESSEKPGKIRERCCSSRMIRHLQASLAKVLMTSIFKSIVLSARTNNLDKVIWLTNFWTTIKAILFRLVLNSLITNLNFSQSHPILSNLCLSKCQLLNKNVKFLTTQLRTEIISK